MPIRALLAVVVCFCLSANLVVAQDSNRELDEFFAADHLVQVDIQIDEDDWLELCAQTRSFAEALKRTAPDKPYTYFEADVTIDGVEYESVGLRKKGFIGSLDDVRPSLKIRFDEFEDHGPFHGLDRLTLNNNKQDPSQMSAFITMRLFREAGVPASRCNWAHVTVNGESLGIYSNVESIRKPFLADHFGSDEGNLYEGTVADLYTERLERYEIKTNRKNNEMEDLRELAELLDSPGDDFVDEIKERIDYDRFLQYWAIESLTGWWDGYSSNQNNYFMYRDPTTSRFTFMPWGTDASFAEAPSILYKEGPESVRTAGRLGYVLYQYDEVRQDYRDVLLALLTSVWDEERIIDDMNRYDEMLADYVIDRQGDRRGSLRRMTRYIANRREVIMEEMGDGPVEAEYVSQPPMYFGEIGRVTGDFDATWSFDRSADAVRSGEPDIELVIEDEVVSFETLGVKAEPGQPFFSEGGETPPTLIFTGQRSSDGKLLILSISFTSEQFHGDHDDELISQGILMEGFNFSFEGEDGMKFLSGTIDLKEAAEEDGATVRGSINMGVYTMKGLN